MNENFKVIFVQLMGDVMSEYITEYSSNSFDKWIKVANLDLA